MLKEHYKFVFYLLSIYTEFLFTFHFCNIVSQLWALALCHFFFFFGGNVFFLKTYKILFLYNLETIVSVYHNHIFSAIIHWIYCHLFKSNLYIFFHCRVHVITRKFHCIVFILSTNGCYAINVSELLTILKTRIFLTILQ